MQESGYKPQLVRYRRRRTRENLGLHCERPLLMPKFIETPTLTPDARAELEAKGYFRYEANGQFERYRLDFPAGLRTSAWV